MSQDAYGGKKSLIKIQRQSHDEKNNQSTRWKKYRKDETMRVERRHTFTYRAKKGFRFLLIKT
jgi:hypothetical protein